MPTPRLVVAPSAKPASPAVTPSRGLRTVPPREEKIQRLEAILFLARDPLSSRKLSQYANLADATEARTLVRQLNNLYDESGRAFRVEEVAGGYQLFTRPQFGSWLRRLQFVPGELRLSAPALETLAVVAYRQPVGRAEVDAIRGVHCGEILRQLMERDLVQITGRSEELGRPYLYGTTPRFLQLFGLKGLEDLPRAEIFRDTDTQNNPSPADGNESQQDRHRKKDARLEEDSDVRRTSSSEKLWDEKSQPVGVALATQTVRLVDEDEDEDFEDEVDDDDDEEDDVADDVEEDEVFEEEEDDDLEDDDEEDDDDDFEDDEWEEVEDEEEEAEEEADEEEEEDWEEDDDDDLDWDDDDDAEEEEEEEESWE